MAGPPSNWSGTPAEWEEFQHLESQAQPVADAVRPAEVEARPPASWSGTPEEWKEFQGLRAKATGTDTAPAKSKIDVRQLTERTPAENVASIKSSVTGAPVMPDYAGAVLDWPLFGRAADVFAGASFPGAYIYQALKNRGLPSPGDVYSKLRGQEQAEIDAARRRIPGITGALGMGAAVASPLSLTAGAGNLAAKVGLPGVARFLGSASVPAGLYGPWANLGRNIGVGALEGGGQGALAAATNPDPNGPSVARGAANGAVFGATLPTIATAASNLPGFVRRLVNGADYGKQDAVRLLSNAVHADEQGNATAGLPPLGPQDLLDRLQSSNKPLTLADVGGESTRARAEAAYKSPGTNRQLAAQTLTRRMIDQPDRVAQDVSNFVTRGNAGSAEDTLASLKDQRSRAAALAYARAYLGRGIADPQVENRLQALESGSGPVSDTDLEWLRSLPTADNTRRLVDPALDPFLETFQKLGYDKEARKLADIDQRNFTGGDRLAGPNGKTAPAVSMRDLDYFQRSLRDAELAARENGMPTTRSVAINQLRNRFLGTVDQLNPDFAQARKLYSDSSTSMDAVNLGRQYVSATKPDNLERIRQTYEGLAPGDQDFFRVGLAQGLADKVNRTGFNSDGTKAFFNARGTREKLMPVFPSPSHYEDFANAMADEALMGRTATRMIGGSRTNALESEHGAEDAELGPRAVLAHALLGGAEVAHGNVVSPMMRLGRTLLFNKGRVDQGANSELQRMLFSTDPKVQQEAIEAVLKHRQLQQLTQRMNLSAVRGGGRFAGQLTGGLPALQSPDQGQPQQPFRRGGRVRRFDEGGSTGGNDTGSDGPGAAGDSAAGGGSTGGMGGMGSAGNDGGNGTETGQTGGAGYGASVASGPLGTGVSATGGLGFGPLGAMATAPTVGVSNVAADLGPQGPNQYGPPAPPGLAPAPSHGILGGIANALGLNTPAGAIGTVAGMLGLGPVAGMAANAANVALGSHPSAQSMAGTMGSMALGTIGAALGGPVGAALGGLAGQALGIGLGGTLGAHGDTNDPAGVNSGTPTGGEDPSSQIALAQLPNTGANTSPEDVNPQQQAALASTPGTNAQAGALNKMFATSPLMLRYYDSVSPAFRRSVFG